MGVLNLFFAFRTWQVLLGSNLKFVMADWDADDFEPDVTPAGGAAMPSDKWDGEDEDDDVKDAWDAESEEEKDEDPNAEKVVKVKKKKTLAQKIAEKEEAAEQARLERLAREEADKELDTPEGKLAEKLRLQKMTEENDLKLAREMMGMGSDGGVIDSMNPETQGEFEELSKAVLEKFTSLESSEFYQDFAENFVKNLCMSLTVPTLKKVKLHVEAFHSTKLKEDKATAAKAKKGKTTKSTLKFDTDNQYMSGTAAGGYDDMDDFM